MSTALSTVGRTGTRRQLPGPATGGDLALTELASPLPSRSTYASLVIIGAPRDRRPSQTRESTFRSLRCLDLLPLLTDKRACVLALPVAPTGSLRFRAACLPVRAFEPLTNDTGQSVDFSYITSVQHLHELRYTSVLPVTFHSGSHVAFWKNVEPWLCFGPARRSDRTRHRAQTGLTAKCVNRPLT